MKKIILIIVGLSIFLNADFTRDDLTGIVSDSKTGLEWQDDYTDNGDAVKDANWTDAINYCEALTLGGLNDWRLPNYNELYSLGDRTKSSSAIFEEFVNTVNNSTESYYWTSTTTNNKDVAWVIRFTDATNNTRNKNLAGYSVSGYYVRCVRDAE